MKIAILGTRGIPNRYGGYEAFAERFAVMMAERGHDISVFNSSLHPYKENTYKGVEIIHCSDPEDKLGTAGQFIYDLNCTNICRKRNFDVILQLGYTSSSVWSFLFPGRSAIITNMDGLEWKRDKYPAVVKVFLKQAERWAAQNSDHLIADNIAIQDYLEKKYAKDVSYISYGADVFSSPDENMLKQYAVKPSQYNMLVARIEPENNIETVIQGHLLSDTRVPLLIIGGVQNEFAKKLKREYASEQILFLNGIYDSNHLSQLRFFSNLYFHGHSVGGTNPSLLEAMASSALICAHDNSFNRAVLNGNAFYFKTRDDIANLLRTNIRKEDFTSYISNNLNEIKTQYNWENITDAYENVFFNHYKKL